MTQSETSTLGRVSHAMKMSANTWFLAFHNVLLVLLLSVPLLGTASCGGGGTSGENKELGDRSAVGTLALALTLPGGEDQVSSVEWEVQGEALSNPWTGNIDVSGEGDTVTTFVSGLPAGTGYTVTLTATTEQGSVCRGSATFDILAGEVTRLALVLSCRAEDARGDLAIKAELNQCPKLGRVTVTPTEVVVGSDLSLDASATDADGDELSYAWSIAAGAGAIAEPDQALTQFVCTEIGAVSLRLSVSDGSDCEAATLDVEVVCSAASTEEPGPEPDPEPEPEPGPEPGPVLDQPAPAPLTYRVLQDVHTDAVATFLEGGALVLGTKADVPEGNGTRFQADEVWFHVDDDSTFTVPVGLEFVAPVGTSVWLAPESNPGGTQLWPGFSTESVPVGALDGDQTTLTLVGFEGPGDLEVFTGGFGGITRLWSSNEAGVQAFTLGRTHSHASWAFTESGLYRITVEASATRSGTPVTARTTYTFIVGELPEDVATTTALSASATSVVRGESVTFSASVSPASVEGFVEFQAGTTVLGHAPLVGGAAELTTANFALGTQAVTAVFVPAVENLAEASASAPVTITATDQAGTEFAVTGVAASYQPGDILQARIAGVTLAAEQEIEWRLRPVGTTDTGTVLGNVYVPEADNPDARAGRLDLRMDPSFDGYELQAVLIEGDIIRAMTGWASPILVPNAVEPLSLTYDGPTPFRLGDTVTLVATGRELADGESLVVVVNSFFSYASTWAPFAETNGIFPIDERTFTFEPAGSVVTSRAFALQVVRDGLVVAQSEPLRGITSAPYTFNLEGIQPLYRAGQTLSATVTVTPDLGDALTYSWAMRDDLQNPMKVAQGEEGRTFEMPVTADMHGKRMYITATVAYASGRTATVGSTLPTLNVTDVDPSEQVFQFNALSDHYHQGGSVNLNLVLDPGLTAEDAVAWEWRWPGLDWEALPGAEGLSHRLTAEQAMDGVEVRATLSFADPKIELVITAPVLIHVDDHGTPALQWLTVTGETSVTQGDTVTLSRQLPDNGPTILITHRWERRAAGETEFTTLAGETGATLSFPAAPADDGAEYRVAILKPNGQIAYGPSLAVTLVVQ